MLIIANGDKCIAKATSGEPLANNKSYGQQYNCEAIKPELGLWRAEKHAKHLSGARFQAVGTIDELLLAVKKVIKNHQRRLGDDGKINSLNTISKNKISYKPGDNRRNHPYCDQGESGRPERLPKERQLLHSIVLKELGNSIAPGFALGVEHQVHRHTIATQGKKYPLAEAEQARIAPDQVNCQGGNGKRKVTTKEIKPEIFKDSRQDEQSNRQQNPRKKAFEKFQGWCLNVDGLARCGMEAARSGFNGSTLLREHAVGTELQEGDNEYKHEHQRHTRSCKEFDHRLGGGRQIREHDQY